MMEKHIPFLTPDQMQGLLGAIERITEAPREFNPECQSADPTDVVRLLTSKPWRRTSVNDETATDIQAKVAHAMATAQPIRLAVPFGGYKSWRARTFPHIDWAEVFWLDYLYRYSRRLVEVYKPGVEISLSYTGGILSWMNDLPPNTAEVYQQELSGLLQIMSRGGVQFALEDHSLAYGGPEEVITKLERQAREGPMPGEKERMSAARNLFPRLGQTHWSPDDIAVEQSARRCSAMLALDQRRKFNKFGPRIQITHIRGAGLSLHLGSTRSSVAQPWVMSGYLEWDTAKSEWIERLANTDTWPKGTDDVVIEHSLGATFATLQAIPVLCQ